MNLYDAFALKLPGIAMKREEPLSMHTSFHIGGPAELMAFPATEGELSQLLRAAAELGVRPMLLGAGTNVLAPDEGLRGLVIVTRDCLTGLERRGAGGPGAAGAQGRRVFREIPGKQPL